MSADPSIDLDGAPVLVTGAAGFAWDHRAERSLAAGREVLGVDNLSDYYNVALKRARLVKLKRHAGFSFWKVDMSDAGAVYSVFAEARPRIVANLAAQTGLWYSLDNPRACGRVNLSGFLNVLEACGAVDVHRLVHASLGSVYGGNTKLPFSEQDAADHPVSLYAATKRANELMAHSYAHVFGLPATGLRFFTAYGPWGRADMAYYRIFAEAILADRPITLFNHGHKERDPTYLGDVVDAVERLLPRPPQPDQTFDRGSPDRARGWAPHRVFNAGNPRREPISALIAMLEAELGATTRRISAEMAPGDVLVTLADVSALTEAVGYAPKVSLAEGLAMFVKWFKACRTDAGGAEAVTRSEAQRTRTQ